MTELNPRAIALTILDDVLERSQSLDQALEANKPLAALEPRDRGFVRLLVATVLRKRGTLDKAIDSGMASPNSLHPFARQVLRLGLAQLRYLETKPHAAVSTSVDLVASRFAKLKGLVNAVLRRAETLSWDESPTLNIPPFLWRRWVANYGEDQTQAIAAASLSEAPLDLTVKTDAAGWAQTLGATVLPLGTIRLADAGAVPTLPGFDNGAWWVQDIAASLPAKLLGDLTDKYVIDLCAAPGGKTAQLAALGARVTAIDRSGPRLNRLKQNLQRLSLTAEIVNADAGLWQPKEPADAVVLDAPCLATGTIRRHPDILYLKWEDDLKKLVALQARLLAHAATMLKPGGTLIYCTCSLEREEGEDQIRAVKTTLPLKVDSVRPEELPGLEGLITREGYVRALPSYLSAQGGMDGFFIARLKRI